MAFPKRMFGMFLVMFAVGAAAAQTDKPQKPPVLDAKDALDGGSPPATATIDKIMDQAVRNIAVRYNLNDVQTQETRKLMKREVYRFLKEHENKVWPVIRDLLGSQLEPPENRDNMMRVGKAAKPLARLAKEAIFRANEEWRLILRPDQKKMHDFDMAEMTKTFDQINANFDDWEAGKQTGRSVFPKPEFAGQPPLPSRPPKGSLPKPEVEVFDPNNIFEALVEDFIEEYELGEGQITSARSILEEFKGKANDFKDARKLAFLSVALQQQEAFADRDIGAIKKAAAAHKKLLEPIYQLCGQMDDRLKGLLTTAQIQRREEKGKVVKVADQPSRVTKRPAPKKKQTKSTTESAETASKAGSDQG